MGLALHKEYLDQLDLVQKEIGFSFIRGHGLFTDDMAIYREYKTENGDTAVEYCFTYLDRVMDSYLERGIKPFLELGFMPKALASGEQTVFYWKGNVTPPKDYQRWTDLVVATLSHLCDRYGRSEVVTWPVEVWNEPNLSVFWKDADMEEYFKLFEHSFRAIKAFDSRFCVGGPAVCAVNEKEWLRRFLEFCGEKAIRPDFVTRHHYTAGIREHVGHYCYPDMEDPETGRESLRSSREIVDAFPAFAGLPIHVTEFNTSYVPNNPVHDTNLNAAYLAHQLSWLGDVNDSYSYWTFGDVFEEQGVPFTPFHGGFGLVANGCIPKPTFWTFAFYKKLTGKCVYKGENAIVTRMEDGSYRGVAWNHTTKRSALSLELAFSFTSVPSTLSGDGKDAPLCLLTKTVDEACCNPLKVWHDLGEPSSLTREQRDVLIESSRPAVSTRRLAAGERSFTLELSENAVVYFSLNAVKEHADRGFSYTKVVDF